MLKSKITVTILLLAVCLYDDIRLFTKPRENWRAAAVRMKRLATPGTCLVFEPASSLSLYLVFEKSLAAHQCDDYSMQHDSRIVLATSPYGSGNRMVSPAFAEETGTDGNKPAITVYRRR